MFEGIEVNGKMRALTTALEGLAFGAFILEEALETDEEKGAKGAVLVEGFLDPTLGKELGDELLGEVFGVLRALSTASDIGVERIPVLLAERPLALG